MEIEGLSHQYNIDILTFFQLNWGSWIEIISVCILNIAAGDNHQNANMLYSTCVCSEILSAGRPKGYSDERYQVIQHFQTFICVISRKKITTMYGESPRDKNMNE